MSEAPNRWHMLSYNDEDRVRHLKEIDRTPETIGDDIVAIRNWLEKQPHLPKDFLDDERIEKFIVLSKGAIEITKQRLEFYLSLATLYPEIFDHLAPDSDRVKDTLRYMVLVPLPRVTKSANRIVFATFLDGHDDSYDPIACFLYVMCMAELRLTYDYRFGDVNVCDLKHVKFGLYTKLTPMLMKTTLDIVQGAFGNRIHKVLFINTPPLFEKVITLVKSFVNPKIANRIEVCKDMDAIYEYVPREILPMEYGGDEESMFVLQEKWYDKMLEASPAIKRFANLRVDKNLMPKRYPGDDLGVEGNFRKLDID